MPWRCNAGYGIMVPFICGVIMRVVPILVLQWAGSGPWRWWCLVSWAGGSGWGNGACALFFVIGALAWPGEKRPGCCLDKRPGA